MTNLTSDPGILILISLADGPRHGYAIMSDIDAFAHVQLGPGTLYGAIARLERDGLIEPIESEDRRRPYRLTPSGQTFLAGALDEMRSLAQTAAGRLAL